MKTKHLLLGASLFFLQITQAQQPATGQFIERPGGYYVNTILKDISGLQEQSQPSTPKTKKVFKAVLQPEQYPTKLDAYKQVWHNKPISQGNTGTCWCFSTTSFYESEIKRLSGKEIKLSELYPVYWEYVERARLFVQKRGEVHLGEGSETNAVAKLYKKYGAVPAEAYSGKANNQQRFHNHEPMFAEFENYLKGIKATNAWNEAEVVATVQSILNHYMGEPPTSFTYNGKKTTPQEFLKNDLKLNMDDYVDIMSLMQVPYWTKAEYDVPDNWWDSEDYYNVPLNDFVSSVKKAIDEGYSLSIGGDVSEPGMGNEPQVAVIPTFDIPSQYIDESARQYRFTNGSTTDDHAMHLVGYTEKDGKTWFLLKDSSSGSRNCGETCSTFGYYFMHEDFVKLKMMTFTAHKDAVKTLLNKVR